MDTTNADEPKSIPTPPPPAEKPKPVIHPDKPIQVPRIPWEPEHGDLSVDPDLKES